MYHIRGRMRTTMEYEDIRYSSEPFFRKGVVYNCILSNNKLGTEDKIEGGY